MFGHEKQDRQEQEEQQIASTDKPKPGVSYLLLPLHPSPGSIHFTPRLAPPQLSRLALSPLPILIFHLQLPYRFPVTPYLYRDVAIR